VAVGVVGVTATVVAAGPALVLAVGTGVVVVSVGVGTGVAMLAEGGALLEVVGSIFGSLPRVTYQPATTVMQTRTAAPTPSSAYGGLFVGTTGSACHELFVDAPGKLG